MEAVKKMNKWANRHSYFVIDVLRVVCGGFLVWKGISFLTNVEYYDYYAQPLKKIGLGMVIIHYVVAANLVGGIMIVFGLLTRWAIIAQLPILFGALIINYIHEMNTFNYFSSMAVIAVFIFFLFFGSGKHSADYYFKMQS